MLRSSSKSLTTRNIEKNLEILRGHLPNPNSKVLFIAISKIKQARRLIFGMYLYSNINRRNIEREYNEVFFKILILRFSS